MTSADQYHPSTNRSGDNRWRTFSCSDQSAVIFIVAIKARDDETSR